MPVTDYYDGTKWKLNDEAREIFERELKSLKLIKSLEQANTILDVGCGDGFFLKHLANHLKDRKPDLWGVDYSRYKLGIAKKAGINVKHCDLEKGLPFEESAFDLIYAAELIEHLYNPDYFLEECRRVLRKGGHVLITTPNLQAWYNRMLFLLGIQPIFYEVSTKSPQIGSGPLKRIKKGEAPVGHVHVFNHAGLTDMLKNEGFKIVTTAGARFQALPKGVRTIDKAFNALPSFASNMIVVAQKI